MKSFAFAHPYLTTVGAWIALGSLSYLGVLSVRALRGAPPQAIGGKDPAAQ